FQALNFVLCYACCVLVALVSLEISGLYGNPLGAMPAIWSGLLFAINPALPVHILLDSGEDLKGILCVFFYVLAFWCYQRYCLIQERPYLIAAIISSMVSLYLGLPAISLPFVVAGYELLFLHKRPSGWFFLALLVMAPFVPDLGYFVHAWTSMWADVARGGLLKLSLVLTFSLIGLPLLVLFACL